MGLEIVPRKVLQQGMPLKKKGILKNHEIKYDSELIILPFFPNIFIISAIVRYRCSSVR